uniref:BRCT domain-containing protein n=1 Tax=Kalanchoe fedtschenkoi TaxID=63787 RepID=A0A7N0T456_KALFE
CVIDNCLTLTKQRRILLNEFSTAKKKGSQIEAPPVPMTESFLSSKGQNCRPMKILSLKEPVGNESNRKDNENLQDPQGDSCVQTSSKQHDLSERAPLKDCSEVEDSPAIPPEHHAIDIHGSASVACGLPSKIIQTTKSVQEATTVEVSKNSKGLDKSQSPVKGVHLRKCGSILNKIQCAFCQSAEATKPYGKIIHYFDGSPVSADHNEGSNLIHSHRHCAEWAPNVYFKDDTAINLKAELARSRRISCSCCGCHRSFHVPCAKLMPECRWDSENYVMFCPLYASSKFPCEMSVSERQINRASEIKRYIFFPFFSVNIGANCLMHYCYVKANIYWMVDSHRSLDKIVLCGSALADFEKDFVSEFTVLSGIKELKKWSSSVTHVIASVDKNEACRRTLKILMAILEGKWILSAKWLKACIDAKRLVDEQAYEVTVDIHGIRDGPWLGRLRVLHKEPILFHGLEFFFYGEFVHSYKGYLRDLITAGGGTILHRKPFVSEQSRPSTFIIYNLELPEKYDPSKKDTLIDKRISEANALASSTGAIAASNTWIFNSITACQLQMTEIILKIRGKENLETRLMF